MTSDLVYSAVNRDGLFLSPSAKDLSVLLSCRGIFSAFTSYIDGISTLVA